MRTACCTACFFRVHAVVQIQQFLNGRNIRYEPYGHFWTAKGNLLRLWSPPLLHVNP